MIAKVLENGEESLVVFRQAAEKDALVSLCSKKEHVLFHKDVSSASRTEFIRSSIAREIDQILLSTIISIKWICYKVEIPFKTFKDWFQ